MIIIFIIVLGGALAGAAYISYREYRSHIFIDHTFTLTTDAGERQFHIFWTDGTI